MTRIITQHQVMKNYYKSLHSFWNRNVQAAPAKNKASSLAPFVRTDESYAIRTPAPMITMAAVILAIILSLICIVKKERLDDYLTHFVRRYSSS